MVRRLIVPFAAWLLLVGALRAEEGYFDSDGVKIHYVVEGQGEPVLLIHGFAANANMNWIVPGVLPALAKEFRVIAIDNRGHGKSDKPHDPKQYGQHMVDDSLRLLDYLKIDRAHVVGYSMGGGILLKLLTTHPERLRSAVICASGWSPPSSDDRRLDDFAQAIEQGKGFRLLLDRLTPPDQPRPTEEQVKFFEGLVAGNDLKALAAVIRGMKGAAVPEEKLKEVRTPTLAVVGALDTAKKGAETLKEHVPGIKLVIIDGANHFNAALRPELRNAIRDFIKAHAEAKEGAKSEGTPSR
jgi:pimeloyl-ACP methyl ester carboxylesterase